MASNTHSVIASAAGLICSSVAKLGAIRMLLSFGSRPPGNGAPAVVNTIPASLASSMTRFAQPGRMSRLMKYPPLGLGPLGNTAATQLAFEDRQHLGKFRRQNSSMLIH